MSAISTLSQSLASLLPKLGSEQFSGLLINTVRTLVPVDEASIIVYETASTPYIDFAYPGAWTQPILDAFLNSAFLLDPYYIAATRENKSGFFRLRDLAPAGFQRSEYYRVYYRKTALCDVCGYLIPILGDGFVNISLGRTGASAFSKNQLLLLEDISSLIASICGMHWQQIDKTETNFRGQLEAALGCFGDSLLTRRERQVTNLILLGHSTKKLADVLGISPETVKLHRKHAYAKLDVRTQSELFYLFIDSVMSIDGYASGDPLIAYLQTPRKPTGSMTTRAG